MAPNSSSEANVAVCTCDNDKHGTTSREMDDDNLDEDDPESSESESSNDHKILGTLAVDSVVQYYGPGSSYCGYCKRSELESGVGRRSYDMQTYSLRAADYQTLLDRNWRRSGTYGYCPINHNTCCPNYPVICTATKFQLTRSQRKCITKINSYLAAGVTKCKLDLDFTKGLPCEQKVSKRPVRTLNDIATSSKLRDKRLMKSCERKSKLYGKTKEEAMKDLTDKWDIKQQTRPTLESYLFPKKEMLLSNDDRKCFSAKHVLKIEMLHVNSERCAASREDQHKMLVRYQKTVHKETRREWTMSRFRDFLVSSPLITEHMTQFDYATCTSSPINGNPLNSNVNASADYLLVQPPELPTAYGTYHCNYHLDGELIATGVLDVLPKCITTVYFFYNPDYDFLNLGIYSALVEISMIRQMDKHFVNTTSEKSENSENQLVNYYLGFYVPECKKMHYKTRFRPAYLLCSKTLKYVPIEKCLEKLSDRKYADFNEEQVTSSEEGSEILSIDLNTIRVITPIENLGSSLVSYILWIESNLGHEYRVLFLNGYLGSYVKLVGLSLLPRLTMRVNVVHQTLLERHRRLTESGQSRNHNSGGIDL